MPSTIERLDNSSRVTAGEAIATQGHMIALKQSDGKAYKATDAAGYRVIGINDDKVASGAKFTVKGGKWLVKNSTTAALTQKDIGGLAYVEDSETVTTNAGADTNLIAGKIIDVQTEGVWVDFDVQTAAALSAT